jgi:glutathione S-transferase
MIGAALVVSLLSCPPQGAAPAAEKLPLKLVYAGNAGTPYTAAQLEFLEAHAASVKFVAGAKLTAADLKGADVLLVDGEVESKDDKGELRLKSEKIDLTLGEAQGMPIVAIGGEGGFFMDNLKLKLSWHHG